MLNASRRLAKNISRGMNTVESDIIYPPKNATISKIIIREKIDITVAKILGNTIYSVVSIPISSRA
jgi:hypothetical protein